MTHGHHVEISALSAHVFRGEEGLPVIPEPAFQFFQQFAAPLPQPPPKTAFKITLDCNVSPIWLKVGKFKGYLKVYFFFPPITRVCQQCACFRYK